MHNFKTYIKIDPKTVEIKKEICFYTRLLTCSVVKLGILTLGSMGIDSRLEPGFEWPFQELQYLALASFFIFCFP